MEPKQYLFIANGKFFISLEKVEEYAKELGLRITNIETIRGPKNHFPNRKLVFLNK